MGVWLRALLAGGMLWWTAGVQAQVTPDPVNLTALWYDQSQAGHGVNVVHQGSILFVAWYVYGSDGKVLWMVAAASRQTDGRYIGAINSFNGQPFNLINNAQANTQTNARGEVRLSLTSDGKLDFAYTIDNITQTRRLEKAVFVANPPVCTFTTASRAGASNYTDVWWKESESGWGISIIHQGDLIFIAWYTYGTDGKPMWVTGLATRQANGSYSGELNRPASGTAFNLINGPATTFPVPMVGTFSLSFSNGETGIFSYTIDGVSQSKAITRLVYVGADQSKTVCAGQTLPQGAMVDVNNARVIGWARDPDAPNVPVEVHFYMDGPAGAGGTFLGLTMANRAHPDTVGGPFANRAFYFDLPPEVQENWPHAIYTYAINIGDGANPLLEGSPRTLTRTPISSNAKVWMSNWRPWVLGRSNSWPTVRRDVDVLKLYIDEVAQANLDELVDLVSAIEGANIELAIELGGLVDWRAGEVSSSTGESLTAELSFQDEFAKIERLTRPRNQGGAGGRLAKLNIDGPIRRMLYPGGVQANYHSVDSAVDELVQVLRLWRNAFPDVEFHIISNFPNWGWRGEAAYHDLGYSAGSMGLGDYYPVLQKIIERTRAAGVPIKGITIDNPYDYAVGRHESAQPLIVARVDWIGRIREVEEIVEGNGLDFSLIVNGEHGGNMSPRDFTLETLAFVDAYHARGGTPSGYVVQSWYLHPAEWLPESADYTMTNLVYRVLQRRLVPSAKSRRR